MIRVAIHVQTRPDTNPNPNKNPAFLNTNTVKSVRCAPRAMRIPNSRVRQLTE